MQTKQLYTRRSFIKSSAGAAALAVLEPAQLWTADSQLLRECNLRVIGKLKPKPSAEIAASPLGIGFETLDRKQFDPERTFPHLAQLGAKWARVQTGWGRCEPSKGRYDFAWLDSVVDRLRGMGIQPWFNLGYGNRLYTPEAPDDFAVGWVPLNGEEAQQGWLHFTRALAGHFRDRVKHWEIWNEPNHPNFWKPHKADPGQYVKFVRMTAPVIRKAVPGAVIIGPAVWDPGYFQSCFEYGLGELVDKVSYHWYRPTPEDKYEPSITACREVLARHNLTQPLWQGESGCPSKQGGAGAMGSYAWTEDLQARWVLRRTLNDLRLGIEVTSYFHAVDVLYAIRPGLVRLDGMNYKGLLRGEDYTPKPAYFAYQCLCALFDSQTQRTALPLKLSAVAGQTSLDEALLLKASFIRMGKPLYACWMPADLRKPLPSWIVSLSIPHTSGADLDTPVLVDPLNATVFELSGATRSSGSWEIPKVPLNNYPLIITDRSVARLA